LDDQPKYYALSYVWGNPLNLSTIGTVEDGSGLPILVSVRQVLEDGTSKLCVTHQEAEPPSYIIIDNEEVLITANLGRALESLQCDIVREADNGPYSIWVDAICINQQDHKEKASQIPLMGRIYSAARLVVAYLGPGDEQITRAIKTLKEARPHLQASLRQDDPDLNWIEQFPQIWSTANLDGNGENDFLIGVRRLFSFAYWRRAWILQEMVLSNARLVLLTSSSAAWPLGLDTIMAWDDLVTRMRTGRRIKRPECFPAVHWYLRSVSGVNATCNTLKTVVHLIKQLRKSRNWKMKTLREFCDTSFSLIATDPKDKIYALMNLMELDITVDYSDRLSTESLYTEFARIFIGAQQESDVMACSGIGKGLQSRPHLPSWVPEWDRLSIQLINSSGAVPYHLDLWESYYEAHRGLDLPRWRTLNNSLLAHGCLVEHTVGQGLLVTRDHKVWLSEVFDFCAEFVDNWKSMDTVKLTVPPLQHVITTLLRDLCPEVAVRAATSDDRLHGRTDIPGREIDLALLFLSCITDLDRHEEDPKVRQDKICERVRLLGYDSPAKLFEDFPKCQLYPKVTHVYSDETPVRKVVGFPSSINLELFSSVLISRVGFEEARTTMLQSIEQSSTSRLIKTSNGRLALVPQNTVAGDCICALGYCRYPVVLRKVENAYVYLGGAFRYGLMDGEVSKMMDDRILSVEEFVIQ
jgi:hypothetical protein